MNCPVCGNEVSSADKYCCACGAELNNIEKSEFKAIKNSVRNFLSDEFGIDINKYQRCLNCGQVVKSDDKFCENCGSKISKQKECPFCNTKNDNDNKYCVSCGKEIKDYVACDSCQNTHYAKDSYCLYCGTKGSKAKKHKKITYNNKPVIIEKPKEIKKDVLEEISKPIKPETSTTSTKVPALTYVIIGIIVILGLLASTQLYRNYTITYHNVNGLNNVNPSSYRFIDSKIIFQDVEKDGYQFMGWYEDEACTKKVLGIKTMSTGNVDVYAKFGEKRFHISYDLAGGYNNSSNKKSYTIQSETIALQNPSKKGYTFLYWLDKTTNMPIYLIDSNSLRDYDLLAVWQVEYYYIEYDNYNFTRNDNPYNFTIEDEFELKEPEREGYKFKGFYLDPGYTKQIKEIKHRDSNIYLYVKWEASSYHIYYDLAGGENNPNNPKTYNTGDYISLYNPMRNGYYFSHWEDDSGRIIGNINRTQHEDVYLTARWSERTFNINYQNTKSKVNYNPKNYTSSQVIYLSNLEDDKNYYFDGWYTSDGIRKDKLEGAVDQNITLYARWTQK